MGGRAYAVAGRAAGPLLFSVTARALLAVVVFLVTGAACSGQANEPYPFSLNPEFPVASSDDEAALRTVAAAFLDSPDWTGPGVHISGWEFAEVAALTRNGQRVGVYGDVAFPSPVALAGEMTFVRCGQAETWRNGVGPPLRIAGLHVRLLDGGGHPWYALPLNADGELPLLRDVAEYTGSANPCP